jgi:hypothetical protein
MARALKELNADLSDVLKGARRLAENGQQLAALAREEGEAYLASSRRIRKKLDRGVDRLSERLDNFDALVEVVHDEVEETAMRFATTLRAARLTTAVLGRCCGTPAMSLRRLATAFIALGLALLILPDALQAWTPGTHIYLAQGVLASAHLLPPTIADLIRAFPYEFLYGNIAADSTIAKNFAPVSRHCHHWHVGQEIHDLAPTMAFGRSAWATSPISPPTPGAQLFRAPPARDHEHHQASDTRTGRAGSRPTWARATPGRPRKSSSWSTPPPTATSTRSSHRRSSASGPTGGSFAAWSTSWRPGAGSAPSGWPGNAVAGTCRIPISHATWRSPTSTSWRRWQTTHPPPGGSIRPVRCRSGRQGHAA